MSAKKRAQRRSADKPTAPEKPYPSDDPAEFRRRAEERLRVRKRAEKPAEKHADDAERVRHELEVHQIELEMQNAELHAARNNLEAALERYTDLYDFAPVGYLTLDETGVILEANLKGATLLGIERSGLINRKMPLLVAPTSRASFLDYLKAAFRESSDHAGEALIRKEGGDTFWASFRAAATDSANGARRTCRVAFADITARREVEEARHRLQDLSDANAELIRENDRRKAAERALRKDQEQKSRLLAQAQRMQAQLQGLSHRVFEAQEAERMRISRELHDVIAQTLVGINFYLAALSSRAATKPADLNKAIVHTQRLVVKAVDHVHRFAMELRPSTLDHLGLIPTLHSFIKEFTRRTGLRVRFKTPRLRKIKELDGASRVALYRVAQEALTNVEHHAQASIVHVSVEVLTDAVRLMIRDDGKSFKADSRMKAKRSTRLGLIGMRERMGMVGGSFIVKSEPGEGTTVIADIPISPFHKRGRGSAR